MLTLVASDRFGRLQCSDPIETKALQAAADGCWRDADFGRDLLAGPALAAQDFDPPDNCRLDRAIEAMGSRGAIYQTCYTFGFEACHPLAHRTRADTCGYCDGLRRLPAQHLHHNSLSTAQRQAGILMDVHPVLRGITEVSQPQFPRPGPDGQPVESSQLERFQPLYFDCATYAPSHSGGGGRS